MSATRPNMAVRFGITGHRTDRIPPDVAATIRTTIDGVLTDLKNACIEIHKCNNDIFAGDSPKLSFISPLADGADTIAAESAIARGMSLLVPLPFARERIEANAGKGNAEKFSELLSRAEDVMEIAIDEDDGDSENAYHEAGTAVLRHSDVLIAVWDGEPAKGIGGTGMIVQLAKRVSIPIVLIPLANPSSPTIFHNNTSVDFSHANAVHVLSQVLLPRGGGADAEVRKCLSDFEQERPPHAAHGWFFRIINGVLSVGAKKHVAAPAPKDTSKSSSEDEGVRILTGRFHFADRSAVRYADIYRSSYYMNYIFAALAVGLALLEVGLGFGKTAWISVEVLVILVILFVTTRGKRRRWHEKWLDYRQLSEMLRRYERVYLSGGALAIDTYSPQNQTMSPSAPWVDWYFKSTVRELGLASGRLSSTTKTAILQDVIDQELNPQIAYHLHNQHTKHKLAHRLHRLGEYAFGATLTVCLVYLAIVFLSTQAWAPWAYETKKAIKGWVTVATGFLPAFGSALFGIRIQGEFGVIADRSAAIASDLEKSKARLEDLIATGNPGIEQVRQSIAEAARIAIAENARWRVVFQDRPLNLPG